jgi:steroid delta-isomerase-like uncharacterized protein
MLEENKAIMKRWFEEVWNKKDGYAIDELLSKDAVIHGLADGAGNPVKGLPAFHAFHAQFCGAFPDVEVNIDDVIAEGDKVVARCSVRGQHSGPHLGIAATNAPVKFEGIAIVRIENGQIAEARNCFDFLAMNKQLGMI